MANTTSPSLLTLPAELHLEIQAYLTYPDLLALKHTHLYFLETLKPTVIDRVDWLLSRTEFGLPIPTAAKLNLKTDAQFCRNQEVKGILLRRRRHEECRKFNGGSCLLVNNSICNGQVYRRRRKSSRGKIEMAVRQLVLLGMGMQMFVLALVGVIAAAVTLPMLWRLSWLVLVLDVGVVSSCWG